MKLKGKYIKITKPTAKYLDILLEKELLEIKKDDGILRYLGKIAKKTNGFSLYKEINGENILIKSKKKIKKIHECSNYAWYDFSMGGNNTL